MGFYELETMVATLEKQKKIVPGEFHECSQRNRKTMAQKFVSMRLKVTMLPGSLLMTRCIIVMSWC